MNCVYSFSSVTSHGHIFKLVMNPTQSLAMADGK